MAFEAIASKIRTNDPRAILEALGELEQADGGQGTVYATLLEGIAFTHEAGREWPYMVPAPFFDPDDGQASLNRGLAQSIALCRSNLQELKHSVVDLSLSGLADEPLLSLVLSELGALPNLRNLRITSPAARMRLRFDGLGFLETLVLAWNELESLSAGDFAGLEGLRRLDLFSNELVEIQPGSFEGLDNLQDLNLGNNNLRFLPPGAFRGMPELRRLDLYRNDLENLSAGLFTEAGRLDVLNLSENRFSRPMTKQALHLAPGAQVLGFVQDLSAAPMHSPPDEDLAGLNYLGRGPRAAGNWLTWPARSDLAFRCARCGSRRDHRSRPGQACDCGALKWDSARLAPASTLGDDNILVYEATRG